MKKKFVVYPSLYEESKEGWVWIPPLETIESEFVRITNPKTRKWIVCERRTIDKNYITKYNERNTTREIKNKDNCIVLNEFYRNKLGISKGEEVEFCITNAKRCIEKYLRAPLNHPNAYVRTNITIGLFSMGLGVLSIILSVLLSKLGVFWKAVLIGIVFTIIIAVYNFSFNSIQKRENPESNNST